MTIEYNVFHGGKLIDAFPRGVLNFKEIIDYFDRLENDNRVKQGAIEIVYFNYVTDLEISYLESNTIIKRYRGLKAIKMLEVTIFVCKTDLAYGFGRMLKTLHEIENPEFKILIVRSESDLESLMKIVHQDLSGGNESRRLWDSVA